MASLRDIRNRIKSVKNTQKITKAMKLVAASKLRKAQDAITAARPYAVEITQALERVGSSMVDGESAVSNPLLETREIKRVLLVVMTSDRGLCGGFNANIAKLARTRIAELRAEGKTIKILTVGKKGRDALRRDYKDLFVDHVDLSEVKTLGYANAQEIAQAVLDRFDEGEFDGIKGLVLRAEFVRKR